MCTNLAAVLPDFIAKSGSAVMIRASAVNSLLITRGLDFLDTKNMAGSIDEQDAKRLHQLIGEQNALQTLIWINRAYRKGGCDTPCAKSYNISSAAILERVRRVRGGSTRYAPSTVWTVKWLRYVTATPAIERPFSTYDGHRPRRP